MATQDNKKSQATDCDIENFKMVTEHFRQDLREYWNRANFYLVTNAGLFSAFLIIYPTLAATHSSMVLLVPILGISIATLWFLVLRGALFWIEQWRQQVIKLSKELDRFQCYYQVESMLKERRYLSPSNLTKFVSVVFILAWVAIFTIVLIEIF